MLRTIVPSLGRVNNCVPWHHGKAKNATGLVCTAAEKPEDHARLRCINMAGEQHEPETRLRCRGTSADNTIMSEIRELAATLGIADHYIDYRGERREIPEAVQARTVAALGFDPDKAASQRAILERRNNDQLVPGPVVCAAGAGKVALRVRVSEAGAPVHWRLQLEDGWSREGDLTVGPASGAAADPGGRVRMELPLSHLPPGYHQLHLTTTERSVTVPLIAVPERCYEPPEVQAGQRLWGLSIQLYSLRSERNWGIGDFGDLQRLAAAAAPLGVGFIGLNPLHALFLTEPQHASPYSPSSRLFLNPVYIDVTAVPGFNESTRVEKLLASQSFQAELARLRDLDQVDYRAVTEAKLAVLGILYRRFRRHHLRRDTPKAQEYLTFVAEQGEALHRFALYQALAERLHAMDETAWGWPVWLPEYQRPDADQVQLFADTNGSRIGFFVFLQWLADRQLAAAQKAARGAGMALGLYRDLAVGSGRGGAEIWANRALFSVDASVGAPPDALALTGQDWGVPPMNPRVLREQGYRGFIELIRANMRHAGALRMDHVMALMRLWWVPRDNGAEAGTYVDYPVDDLLGIVALESQRQRCLVVGEDRHVPRMTPELAAARKQFLACGRAQLMVAHPEDWLAMTEPANVPGTHEEHANWQRKLTEAWETLLSRPDIVGRARAITAARG